MGDLDDLGPLYDRLLRCELALSPPGGAAWFEDYVRVLRLEGAGLDPAWLDLARRLDVVLGEMHAREAGARAVPAVAPAVPAVAPAVPAVAPAVPAVAPVVDVAPPAADEAHPQTPAAAPEEVADPPPLQEGENQEQEEEKKAVEASSSSSAPPEESTESSFLPPTEVGPEAPQETTAEATTASPSEKPKSRLSAFLEQSSSPTSSSSAAATPKPSLLSASPPTTPTRAAALAAASAAPPPPSSSNEADKLEVDTAGMSVKERMNLYKMVASGSGRASPASPASSAASPRSGTLVAERSASFRGGGGASPAPSATTPPKEEEVAVVSAAPPTAQAKSVSSTEAIAPSSIHSFGSMESSADHSVAPAPAAVEDSTPATTTAQSPPPPPPPPTSDQELQGAPSPSQHNDTEGGHIVIPEECSAAFQALKLRKKHRFLIFKIVNWQLQLEKVGERALGLEDFLGALPFAECRYAVYDHERLKSEDQYGSRVAAKAFFICWSPVAGPTNMKMQYTSERKTLTKAFLGVEDVTCTKRDDVLVSIGAKGKFEEEDSGDEERGGNDDWMDN